MNILDCPYSKQGALMFRVGRGISDNPWVAGYDIPFEEANHWHAGYFLEMLRKANTVDEAVACSLGEAAWLSARHPERFVIITNTMADLANLPPLT